ncbi:MAG: FAD-dependent oxidoreductase, partial [Oscillospiraceae bacterium]
LFIAYKVAGSTALAKKIGAVTTEKAIKVDENMKTSIDGLYAAGDCTGGLLQIAKAVYEGAKAGMEVSKHLR